MADMSDTVFAALQDAVTLARSDSIRTLDGLRKSLSRAGHQDEDIDQAFQFWSDQLRERYPEGRRKMEATMRLEGYPDV